MVMRVNEKVTAKTITGPLGSNIYILQYQLSEGHWSATDSNGNSVDFWEDEVVSIITDTHQQKEQNVKILHGTG